MVLLLSPPRPNKAFLLGRRVHQPRFSSTLARPWTPSPTPLSYAKVFKAAKKAILSDKGKFQLDLGSKAVESNINARSDYEGEQAANRQPLKE